MIKTIIKDVFMVGIAFVFALFIGLGWFKLCELMGASF